MWQYPSSPRYPCGVCRHAVHPSDKALLCDSCDKWFHIQCTRVSPEEYDHYITLDQFDWSCLLCLFDILPPGDVCGDCDIISTLSDSQSIHLDNSLLLPSDIFEEPLTADLCVVHHNVQGLLSKFTEISQWLHASYGSNLIVCCSETWLQGDKVPATPGFVSYCSPLLERLKAITWIMYVCF